MLSELHSLHNLERHLIECLLTNFEKHHGVKPTGLLMTPSAIESYVDKLPQEDKLLVYGSSTKAGIKLEIGGVPVYYMHAPGQVLVIVGEIING